METPVDAFITSVVRRGNGKRLTAQTSYQVFMSFFPDTMLKSTSMGESTK
jgi:hypothetical protein